jgi:DNA-binding beta-propeller fold protein YncE
MRHAVTRRTLIGAGLAASALCPQGFMLRRAHAFEQKPPSQIMLISVFCATTGCGGALLTLDFPANNKRPANTAMPRRLAGPETVGEELAPEAAVLGPNNCLYVADFLSNSIRRFDLHTGKFLDHFVKPGDGGMIFPHGLTWGPDGNLYVAARGSGNILRFQGKTGKFIDVFVPKNSGGLNDATDLHFHHDGLLYVSDYTTDGRPPALRNPNPPGRGGAIRRYNASTGVFVDNFVAPGPNGGPNKDGLDGPHAFVFGPDGHLYIASSLSEQILKYNGNTGHFISVFIDRNSGGLVSPEGIAFGPDGNFYVSDFIIHAILCFDGKTGEFIEEQVSQVRHGLMGPGFITFFDIDAAKGISSAADK